MIGEPPSFADQLTITLSGYQTVTGISGWAGAYEASIEILVEKLL